MSDGLELGSGQLIVLMLEFEFSVINIYSSQFMFLSPHDRSLGCYQKYTSHSISINSRKQFAGFANCHYYINCSFGVGKKYMCEVSHLPFDARVRAIRMLQWGAIQAAIADWFGVPTDIVQSLWTRFRDMTIVHGRSHSRHPCVTSQDRDEVFTPRTAAVTFRLLVAHLEAFSEYMQLVSDLWATVCGSTTFAPTCVGMNPVMQQHHFQAQSYWCRRHIIKRIHECWSVLLTDENCLRLDRSDKWDATSTATVPGYDQRIGRSSHLEVAKHPTGLLKNLLALLQYWCVACINTSDDRLNTDFVNSV